MMRLATAKRHWRGRGISVEMRRDDLLADMERWRTEGEALIANGEPARALILLNRALRQDPSRPLASRLYVLRSRALEQLGHIEQALEAADRAVAVDDTSAIAHTRRAAVYTTLGRTTESEADCAAAVRLDPTNAFSWLMWGNRLNAFGRAKEALGAVEWSLALDPTARAAWQEKGIALHHMARYDEALVAYAEALRLADDDAPTRAHLMLNRAIAHREAGRQLEWLEAARAATQVDPTLASAFTEQGAALLAQGRLAEAVDAYEQGTRLDPGNAGAWVQLGSALDRLDRSAEAAEAYAQALERDPALPDARYGRGRALVRVWLALAAANSQERATIGADPDLQSAPIWLDEAWNLYARRRRDLALQAAEEALRLDPANTHALGLKLRLLLQRRQFHEAFTAFRQRLARDREIRSKRPRAG
jgi:tetratricopeptide (TPR) repeat protein